MHAFGPVLDLLSIRITAEPVCSIKGLNQIPKGGQQGVVRAYSYYKMFTRKQARNDDPAGIHQLDQ